MANANDVDIDVVGHDRTEAAFRSVERGLKRLGSSMGTATKTMAKAGAMVASFSSLLGPAAIGVTKVVTATAHAAATMAPLVSLLPSMAAGLILIKGTASIVGPAMAKAFTPVTALFGDEKNPGPLRRGIEAMATKGLPDLARGFAKVNMPAIGGAMKDVAGSMNGIVRGTGRWINSTEGMNIISNLTEATSTEFRLLGPHITAAAIALGRLTGRGSDGITFLFIGITKLVDKFTRWANSMTDNKISDALTAASNAAGGLGEKLRMVKDVFKWIAENPDKIKKMSDSLAGIGIALGLASGSWVAIVAGTVTLMSNHWDELKPKLEQVGKWGSDAFSKMAVDPSLVRMGAALEKVGRLIRGDFLAGWEKLKSAVAAFAPEASKAWAAIGPMIAGFFENEQVQKGLRVMAGLIAGISIAMLTLSAVTVAVAAGIIGALTGVVAWVIGTFVTVIQWAVGKALTAFGAFAGGIGGIVKHIPGMEGVGRALESAGRSATSAAAEMRSVSAAMNGIRSKTVTLTFNQVITRNFTGSPASPGPWAGGYGFGAVGAVVTRPTRAVIGEAGPEMVVPLNRMPGASALPGGNLGGSGAGGTTIVQNFYITQPLANQRDIATAVINSLAGQSAGGMSMAGLRQAIARAS